LWPNGISDNKMAVTFVLQFSMLHMMVTSDFLSDAYYRKSPKTNR
jgi:hypothetical protein